MRAGKSHLCSACLVREVQVPSSGWKIAALWHNIVREVQVSAKSQL